MDCTCTFLLYLCALLYMTHQMSTQGVFEAHSNHGEACDTDSQCADHRMSCIANGTLKLCLCNRFFVWDPEMDQCLQSMNISTHLLSLLEQQDNHKLNSISEQSTFIKLGVVGLFSVLSICVFILCCIAYGCCACTRESDGDDTVDTQALCPPTCPLHKVPLKEIGAKGDKWKEMAMPMAPTFDDIDIC